MDHRSGTVRQFAATAHVRVPSALLYSSVTEPAQLLWAVLDDLARARPSVVVSVAAIAATLGCSERSVRRRAAELQAGGWLEVVGVGGRGRSREWYPQRRARAVDNDADTRTRMAGFAGVNPDTAGRVSRDAPIGTAHAKKEEPGCARCDRGWVERDDGRAARCAHCRPIHHPPF